MAIRLALRHTTPRNGKSRGNVRTACAWQLFNLLGQGPKRAYASVPCVESRSGDQKANINGDLPVSPLANKSFVSARTRWTLPKKARVNSTKFQRKLASNAFAQILASPSRCCPLTKTRVPRDCLQVFKLMAHPVTGDPWWVPPDLSTTIPSQYPVPGLLWRTFQPASATRGPSAYTLPRRDFLHGFMQTSGKYRRGFRSLLRVSGLGSTFGGAVWREDMDILVLELMRRRVYEELLYFSVLTEKYGRKYLTSLQDLDQLGSLHQLGCVFNLGIQDGQYDGSSWRQLAPVKSESHTIQGLPSYDARCLLGDVYIHELQKLSVIFRGAVAVVLRGARTISLQKRLWKLQAYNII